MSCFNLLRFLSIVAIMAGGVYVFILINRAEDEIQSCEWTNQQPRSSPSVGRVASPDLRSLVYFDGYITSGKISASDEHGAMSYLPLRVVSAELADTNGLKKIRMNATCAHLTATFSDQKPPTWEVNFERNEFPRANNVCRFELGAASRGKSQHYKCYQERDYECRSQTTGGSVVTVTIKKAELEIDSHIDLVRLGIFTSRNASTCLDIPETRRPTIK